MNIKDILPNLFLFFIISSIPAQSNFHTLSQYDYNRYSGDYFLAEALKGFYINNHLLLNLDSVLEGYTPEQKTVYWWAIMADAHNSFNFYNILKFHAKYENDFAHTFRMLEYPENRIKCVTSIFDQFEKENKNRTEIVYGIDDLSCELLEHELFKNKNIEKYIRENIDQIYRNEKGELLNKNFTGVLVDTLHDGNGYSKLKIKNGRPVLELKFDSNEVIKHKIYINHLRNDSIKMSYYNNGKIYEQIHYQYINERREWKEKKEYFKTGQLFSYSKYDMKGEMIYSVKYYPNGQKLLETVWEKGPLVNTLKSRIAWDSAGVKTLKDGTGVVGLFILQDGEFLPLNVTHYKDGKRHGKNIAYSNGQISIERWYKDELLDGKQIHYWKNGKIKKEEIFERGRKLKETSFPKWKDFKIDTNLKYLWASVFFDGDPGVSERLESNGLACLNFDKAMQNTFVSQLFLDNLDYFERPINFSYRLEVDGKGRVVKSLVYNDHFYNNFDRKKVESNLMNLEFENLPAVDTSDQLVLQGSISVEAVGKN